MRIPESVRIGGVEYKVEKDVEALNNGEDLLYGEIKYREGVIRLSTVCEGEQMKQITLLHEILHGILFHADASLEDEEKAVSVLAKGLYQVIQDNAYRMADEK